MDPLDDVFGGMSDDEEDDLFGGHEDTHDLQPAVNATSSSVTPIALHQEEEKTEDVQGAVLSSSSNVAIDPLDDDTNVTTPVSLTSTTVPAQRVIASEVRKKETSLKGFSISVNSPVKRGDGLKSYTAYSVQTETDRAQFEQKNMVVSRRYAHFDWLRNKLVHERPDRIIPPLPPKSTLKKNDPNFIERRRQGLERFLRRVAAHSVLSHSKHFIAFLELKSHEFTTYLEENKNPSKAKEALSSGMSSFQQLFKENELSAKFVEEEYKQSLFGEAVSRISSANTKTISIATDIEQSYHQCGDSFKAMSDDDDIALMCNCLVDALQTCEKATKNFIEEADKDYVQPFGDFASFPSCVNEALSYRNNIAFKHESYKETLRSKQETLSKLQSSDQKVSIGSIFGKEPEVVKQEKIEATHKAIEEAATAIEKTNDDVTVANANMSAEIERLNEVKDHDIRNLLSSIAAIEIAKFTTMHDAWASVVNTFEARLEG
eukprot:m.14912 g.14912  ORF g.14912 m.14912 type:complete len:489 (+) comp4393_c0_seq1:63-1529(+)